MTDKSRRDEEVSALLHAPLGPLLVIRCIEEINPNRLHTFLPEDFSEFVIEESDDLRFFTLSVERLSELVVECVIDLSPYASDYQQRIDALLACGPSLKFAAEQLLDAPGTSNWFADLDRRQQVWIAPDDRPPTRAAFHPNLQPFGERVPKPLRALWTSTCIGTCPSSWVPYLRWGEEHRPPPYHPWQLEISPTARVYEIHGPEAWHSLCLAFPLYGPDNRVMPNWEKVARTWDGIHLSVGGLLTTEQVCWSTPQGWTQLSRWNVESTVWLQWVFTQVEHLPDTD